MPVTSDRYVSSTSVSGGGVVNPDNAWASDDVRASFPNLNAIAWYRGLAPFSIDSGMQIDGIEVIVECHYTGSGINRTMQVQLSNTGLGTSAVRSKTISTQTTDTDETFGGPTDKWGETGLTPAYFDDSNLEIRISFADMSVSTIEVDSIRMRVYYSPVATDSRPGRTKGSITVQAERLGNSWGGYEHTHQETFDTTDNKDAGASSGIEWDGDGELKLQS